MIPVKQEPRYRSLVRLEKYRGVVSSEEPCVRCGKAIRRKKRMVHLVDGGSSILHPDDEHLYQSDNGDMYWYPIGSDCARVLGLEWSVDLETHDFG